MSDNRLYLFDTTLRDGAQTQGVDFNIADKTAIARDLDALDDGARHDRGRGRREQGESPPEHA